jgi:hypothetical protein
VLGAEGRDAGGSRVERVRDPHVGHALCDPLRISAR